MAWRSLHLGLWRRRRRRRPLLDHDRLGLRDWYGLHHYWLLHHLDRLLHHLDRLPPNLGKEWSGESHAQTSNGFAKPCDKALLAILHVAGKWKAGTNDIKDTCCCGCKTGCDTRGWDITCWDIIGWDIIGASVGWAENDPTVAFIPMTPMDIVAGVDVGPNIGLGLPI
jgi:hypothetical protein